MKSELYRYPHIKDQTPQQVWNAMVKLNIHMRWQARDTLWKMAVFNSKAYREQCLIRYKGKPFMMTN